MTRMTPYLIGSPWRIGPRPDLPKSIVKTHASGEEIHELMTLCRADITTKNPPLVIKYMGNFERVEERMKNVKELDEMLAFQSPIRGDEIMVIFEIKPGKMVGEIKSAIEEAILNGDIENNYADAKEFLLKNKKTFI